jgi:predicted nucleic-acid-binding Zn-ribbon protein
MAGFGFIIRTIASKLGGRTLLRFLGPVGLLFAVGEIIYLGTKFLGKFDNAYCARCRHEFTAKELAALSNDVEVGQFFEIVCPRCGEKEKIQKVYARCHYCQKSFPISEIKRQLKKSEKKSISVNCSRCKRSTVFGENSDA